MRAGGRRRGREAVQVPEQYSCGEVVMFDPDRGYGFLLRDDDPDRVKVFVHYSEIDGPPQAFRELEAGDRVEFLCVNTPKGLQAREVRRVEVGDGALGTRNSG